MPSLIDHYRRKYPHRLAGKTDEEIAIALANANPGIALMDNRVKELFWAAKSRRNIALGIPFESEQVHRALMQEAEPRRRVVTSPENPTPRSLFEDDDIGLGRATSNAWVRGRLLAKQSQIMSMDLLESGDKQITMKDAEALAEIQRELRSIPQSKEYREFIESEGFFNAIAEFSDEPFGITLQAVSESLSGLWKAGVEGGFDADGNYVSGKVSAGIGIGAATGAGVGTVAAPVTAGLGAAGGAIAGVGLSSHALEATAAYLETFEQAGVDTTNAQALFNAVNDEKTHAKARDVAQKKGLTIAAFDTISAGIAGRGRAILGGARAALRPIAPKLAAAPISRPGVWATELGIQAGMGMAGEAAGSLMAGQQGHWPSILIEGIAEIGPGAVEISAGTILRHGRKGGLTGDPSQKAAQSALAKLLRKRHEEGVPLEKVYESIDKSDYFYEAQKLGIDEEHLKQEYKAFAGTIYRDTNDGTFSEKWEMSEEELAEVQRDEGLTIGVWKENSSARFPDADILEFKGADRFKKARAWVSANRPKKKGRWNYTDDGRRFSILGGSLKPEQYAEIKAHIDKYGEEFLTEDKEDAAPAQGPQPTAEEAVLRDSPTGIDWTKSQEGSVKEGLPEITTEELESEVVKNKERTYGKKGSKEVSDEDAIAHAHQREWKVATDEAATVYDFPKGINKELLGNTLMHSDNNQLTDKAYDLLVAYNPELSAIPLNPSKPQASKWHIVLGALSNFPAVDIAAFVAEKAVQHPTEAHLTGAVHRKVAPPDFSKEDTTGIDIPWALQQELPGMGGARGKRGRGAPIPKAGTKPTAGQLSLFPGLAEDIAPLEKPPTVEELREREVELEEELSKAPKLGAEPEAAKAKAKKGKAVPVPTAERVGETIPVLVPARGPIKWKTIPKQTMGDVKTVAKGTRSRKEIATELKEVQGKIAELEAPKEGASIAQQVQWEIDRIDKRHERLSKAQVAGEELVLEIQEAPMVEPTLNQQYRKLVLSIRSLELRLAEEKKKFDKKGQKEGTKLLENKLAEVRRNREILGKELGIEIREKLTRDPGEVLTIETAQWMQPTPAEEALELNREQRKWNDGPDLSEADTLFVHEWVQGNKERDKYAKPVRGKESEGLKGYPTWLEVLRRNALSLTFSTERAKPIGGRSSSVAYDRAATLMQQTREELQAIFDGRATMKGGMTGPAAAHNFAHFGSFKFLRHRYFDLLKGLKAHKRFDTKVKVEIRDNETVFDQMDRVQVEMDRALSGEAGVSRSADQRAQLAASGKLSKALSIFLEKIQNLVVGQRKFDLMKRPDSTETSELQSEQLYRLINNYLFEEAANWLYKDAVSFKKIKSLKARIRKLQAEERELREQAIGLGRMRLIGGEVVAGRAVVKRTTVWKKLPGQRIARRPMTDEEIDTWERENTPISNVETKERFGYRNIKEGLKKGAVKPYRGPDGKGPIQPGRYEQIDVHIQPYARPDVWVPSEEVENVTNEELKKITLRQGVVNEQIYENKITLRGLERDKDKAGKAHDVGAMFKRIQKEAKIIEGKRAEAVLAGKLPRFEELSAPVAIARYLKGYNPGQAVTVDAKGNLHAIPREHLREAVGSLKKSLERYMREIADSMDISSQDVRMAEKKSLLSHASEMDISEVKERGAPNQPELGGEAARRYTDHLLDTIPAEPGMRQASMSLLEAEKAISEALDKTFENKELGLGPMKRLFHDIILPAVESTGQDVRVHMVGRNEKSMLSDVAGLYFNNNIFLTPLDYLDPAQNYNVLIHESIHMLTDGFARDHESGKQKWVEMEKVFNKAKEVAGKEHIKYADGTQVKVSEAFEYQLSNMKEFVAHAFEHNEFQQWLASVVYEDGAATKTALEWFVHAIKGAFARLGISVSNESTLLDEVVSQAYKALSTRPIETMQTAPLADAVIPMIAWTNQFELFDEARGVEFQYDDSLSNPMGTMYDLGYRDVSPVETPEVAKLKGMTFKSWISKLSYTKVPDPSPEEQLKHINYILDVMKEKEDLALARATSLAEEEGPDVEPMAYFEDELKNIIESGAGLQWMKQLVALVLGTRGSLSDKLMAGNWARTDVVGFHELKAQVEHEKSNLEAILEYPGTISPELKEFYKAKPKQQKESEEQEIIDAIISDLEAKLQSLHKANVKTDVIAAPTESGKVAAPFQEEKRWSLPDELKMGSDVPPTVFDDPGQHLLMLAGVMKALREGHEAFGKAAEALDAKEKGEKWGSIIDTLSKEDAIRVLLNGAWFGLAQWKQAMPPDIGLPQEFEQVWESAYSKVLESIRNDVRAARLESGKEQATATQQAITRWIRQAYSEWKPLLIDLGVTDSWFGWRVPEDSGKIIGGGDEISLSESRRHTRINVSDPNITPESAVAAAEQVMEPAPEKESQMSWWERFYKGVISKSRVFGVAERKVLESRNYSGAPLLATEENHELLNGAPQKAQHKNDQFNAAIKSIIGRGSKIEKDFNTYLFLHRTHARLAKQDELDMRRREILDSVGIEVNADGTIKETEETERMLERLSSEERIELVTLMVSSKKVAEWNNDSVLKGLSGLRSKLGEEKMEEFKRAKDVYNDFLSESLFGLVESGRINMNAYLKILDSSDFYAPFYVAQYFNIKDKSLLEYIKGIQSPDFRLVPLMDAARFKIYTSMMAAEYNKFGLLLTKLAEIDTQGVEIQEFSAEREPSDAVIEYNKSIDDAIAVAKEKLENAKSQATRDKISSEIADLQRKMRMAGKKAIPEGWETIEVYVEGYRHTYIMKEEVASVLKYDGGVAKSGPTLFAEFASDTFKMGATGLNVFFQTFNALLVDPLRLATTSRYGLGLKDFKYGVPVNFAMQYLRGFAASLWANVPLSRGLLQKDKLLGRMMGQPELLVQEFIDSGAAGSTISDYLQREKVRNPVKKHKGWRGTLDPLFEAGGLVRDKLNTVGKIMEYTAKLAGMRRGLDIDGVIKLREKMDNTEDGPALYAMQRELAAKMRKIAIEVRNYVGSPDFARRGTITDAMRLNLVFMFFNARVQGVERDMKRLSDAFRVGNDKDAAKLGAKTIFRLSSLAAVPTIAFWAMNRRKDYDEDYDEISPEDKRHYFHIPLDSFFTHPWTGEKVREYIRIPRRETYGMVSMLIEKGLDHFYKKDPKAVEEMIAATMENLMPINVQSAEGGLELDPAGRFQSILSSLNPVLKTPMELASNMNFYHHSPILSREAKAAPSVEQYYNNTPQLYRKLAKVLGGSPLMWGHGLRGFTGGMVTQFIPEEPVAGRSPLMSSPFTAPAKRLFRSKFIAPTEGMREMEQFSEQEAGIALHRKRLVDKFWGETHDLAPRDRARAAMDMLRAMPQTHDTLLVKRALVRKFRDLNLSREEKMLKSLPVNARSAWLINKLSSMPVDERTEYWQGLVGKRIVTQGVAAQMIRELRPYGGAQSLFPTSP